MITIKRIAWNTKTISAAVGIVIVFSVAAYAGYFSRRIAPHTFIGVVPVGGQTRDQASGRLKDAIAQFSRDGIRFDIEGASDTILLDDISFDLDINHAIDRAFARGHGDSPMANVIDSLTSLVSSEQVDAPVQFDQDQLVTRLGQVAAAHESARQDVRLQISGTTVKLLTDTKPGRAIDRSTAVQVIMQSLAALDSRPITLALVDDAPIADPALAPQALANARKMMARALTLQYEDSYFTISRAKLGGWIMSTYQGSQLVASISRQSVAQYAANVAKYVNIDPQPPQVTTVQGRVTGIVPPRVGQAVKESELVDMILASIYARTGSDKVGDTIMIPVKTTRPSLAGMNLGEGITELVGHAVTTFTGSPKNRISNIKNGVKFISGTIIQPGQEFSALGTLGVIDDTTGYLPELVIKGNRTKPEFGGGLCQVSTTLFRAVMNAGLPITARQNHSYRVSYYEKDGNGVKIGPGLDATVYEPKPDFKFRNDMPTPILIIGAVTGDKVTFDLYGTKDGRASAIIGPKLLSEVPSGPAIYVDTDALPKGMTKQVETPHPGGTATATYIVTYADGRKVTQVFNSRYKPWPAQYLVGTNTLCSTAAQCAAMVAALATPTILPTPSQ